MAMRVFAGGVVAWCVLWAGAVLAQEPRGPNDSRGDGTSTTVTMDPTVTECTTPFRPAVALDGATATIEQINTIADRIRRYQNQLNAYRACLEPMMTLAKDNNEIERFDELVGMYNASVAAEEEVVGDYNRLKTQYCGAHPSDSACA